jgi:hypothetical protein
VIFLKTYQHETFVFTKQIINWIWGKIGKNCKSFQILKIPSLWPERMMEKWWNFKIDLDRKKSISIRRTKQTKKLAEFYQLSTRNDADVDLEINHEYRNFLLFLSCLLFHLFWVPSLTSSSSLSSSSL